MVRKYLDKMHVMKAAEKDRRYSKSFEKRKYSNETFLRDALKAEEHGWFGRAAALYKAGGNEKKARRLYFEAAKQEEEKYNYLKASDYYKNANDFKRSKKALNKILKEEKITFCLFTHNNLYPLNLKKKSEY